MKPVFGGFCLYGKAKPPHSARKLQQQNAAAYCYKKTYLEIFWPIQMQMQAPMTEMIKDVMLPVA